MHAIATVSRMAVINVIEASQNRLWRITAVKMRKWLPKLLDALKATCIEFGGRLEVLTDKDMDKIAADYEKGTPIKLILSNYRCCRKTIYAVIESRGINMRKNGGSARHKKILGMLSHGLRPSDIPERVGCTLQTVYNAIKKAAQ